MYVSVVIVFNQVNEEFRHQITKEEMSKLIGIN